jgi:uncharacterized protein YndB with AHSA1/START domain
MSTPLIHHDRFTIERDFKANPTQVFAAFAQLEAKRRWFGCHEGIRIVESRIDFRVGGLEHWHGWHNDQVEFTNDTVFHHIVPNERIVQSYTMTINGTPLSSSLLTLEFVPQAGGTKLVLTEHLAVLDDSGAVCVSSRIEGTGAGLDNLVNLLKV